MGRGRKWLEGGRSDEAKDREGRVKAIRGVWIFEPHVTRTAPWTQWVDQFATVTLQVCPILDEAPEKASPNSDLLVNRRRLPWPQEGADAIRRSLTIPD